MNIADLVKTNNDPYSVTASITDDVLDPSSSFINGKSNITAPKKDLGKLDFLRLLVTQLQFQNPLEPMDGTGFVSQLAQFTALEGTNNIEKAISSLDQSYKDSLDMQSFSAISMTNASAVSLIGKHVRIAENTVKYLGIPGNDATIRVHLGNADSGTVLVLDKDGKTVRTLGVGDKDAQNSAQLKWDGKDDSGVYVKAGTYYLKIEGQENDSSLYCYVDDVVEGVRYTSEGPLMKIGGKELPIGNILDISMTEENQTVDQGFSTTNALALLGKTVKYKKSKITYTPAENQFVDVHAKLGGLKSAIVEVKNKDGKVVHTFKLEADATGDAHAQLECIDFDKNGPYTLSLAGNTTAYFYGEGTVDGISTVDGVTKIRVNGITVSLSEIYDISQPPKIV